MMNRGSRSLAAVAIIAVAIIAATAAHADDLDRHNEANRYQVNTLVSDAPNSDPVLQNAWGVAFSPAASPFWVSDNATGCSTLYNGDGTIGSLQVKIPLPGSSVPSTACKHVNRPVRRTQRQRRRPAWYGTRPRTPIRHS
jgi:hypothetical protein